MKVTSLQYSYSFPESFDAYQKKIIEIVRQQADQGTELLLFPEYAGLEMLSFTSLDRIQEYLPSYLELFQDLSHQYKMYICAGSHFFTEDKVTFNRSFLFSPTQKVSHQDKCILTPYEIDEGLLSKSNTLRVFETAFGKIGICVCYDIEFPSLVRQLTQSGAELILVPSYTSTIHGYYRVFLSCRARALENQCFVVQSAMVGQTDIELTYGAAAICGPIDNTFPMDGLLAMGKCDEVEAVSADLDFSQLKTARSSGQTRNFHDSNTLTKQDVELFDLR